ncbi:pyroglutamyl-peptidase I [Acerihabitans arboris]|uniref:Pyrrolidone-carboxylate peptidase n=1 Tax=Acerihabitans arboris TaxID=2691583 RepID=A0A845SD90_9GAMM|nr:pyroglutamyl-peptidase I [Acerihabitans arboris]NDL62750.1 pyroglutamyl-peptidase I [Acerihabitans arboris]
MNTVLLTGFEPFGGERVNPSWEVVKQFHERRIDDATVIACRLPCVYGRSVQVLNGLIDRHRPALVLAVGQAGGRAGLSVERVSINIDDARIADNLGQQPIDVPIVADGPAAYFATVPVKAMVQAMRDAGIPAEVSQSAGTYVCNHVMYGLLHCLAQLGYGARGGFIHTPYLPQQAAALPNAPSMAADTIAAGLDIAIRTALQTEHDLNISGGALS